VILLPQASMCCLAAGMLAPDGRCKTLDSAGDGYVRAEGCMLMTLSHDTNACHEEAIIVFTGTAVNQDGRSSSLTSPNGPAQQMCIRQALRRGGSSSGHISELQLHGTGTALGDPIEIAAVDGVFGTSAHEHRIRLQSCKSIMGHAEPAAGIAGILHTVLGFQMASPILHLRSLNQHLLAIFPAADHRGENRSQYIVAKQHATSPLSTTGRGVSAFAYQGTNAHANLLVAHTSELTEPTVLRRTYANCSTRTWSLEQLWVMSLGRMHLVGGALSDRSSTTNVEVKLSAARNAYLCDHRVVSKEIFPAAGYLDAMNHLAHSVLYAESKAVSNLSIQIPMVIGVNAHALIAFAPADGGVTFTSDASLHAHAFGYLVPLQVCAQPGMQMPFCSVSIRSTASNTAVGVMCSPPRMSTFPAILDNAIQLGAALVVQSDSTVTRVPATIALYVNAIAGKRRSFAHVQAMETTASASITKHLIRGDAGEVIAAIEQLETKVLRNVVSTAPRVSDVAARGVAGSATGARSPPCRYTIQWQGTDSALNAAMNVGTIDTLQLSTLRQRAAYRPRLDASGDSRRQILAQCHHLESMGSAIVQGVTLGASSLSGSCAANAACMRALFRTAALESQSSTHCGVLSLDALAAGAPAGRSSPYQAGSEELSARCGVQYCARLLPQAVLYDEHVAMQLVPSPRGALSGLVACAPTSPAAHEAATVVWVRAVGINFRDVLNVLAMYPGDPGPPGSDFSGVLQDAAGAQSMRSGEAAVGFAPGCLGTFAVTLRHLAVSKPHATRFCEAAALPTTSVTVHMALMQAANGHAVQRVLVHAAAGGVGSMAVGACAAMGTLVMGSAGV
jgi:hypothetical protein